MKENGALAIGAVQKLKKEYCVEIRLQRTAFLIPHTTCAINAWKILRGLWKMTVNMGDNVYEMNIAQFAILLSTASKYMPFGIYAVKKDGVAIMLNKKYKSKNELDKDIAKFRNKGFKVYYNEHGRSN